MKIRKANQNDKEAICISFKPLFDDWDYLPYVIDDWLTPSSDQYTWVASTGSTDETLVAMAHAYEIEPGDWYLCALRSNPKIDAKLIGLAIKSLVRTMKAELISRGMCTVRFLTSDYFPASQRLGKIFGFQEQFRQALSWHPHPLPVIPDIVEGIDVEIPENTDELLEYFRDSSGVKPIDGFFCTEWDSRLLQRKHLDDALNKGLLFKAMKDNRMIGAAMYWKNNWQPSLVLSIMEGTDDALRALFRKAITSAGEMGCDAVMIMHLSIEEVERRQRLFGLKPLDVVYVQNYIYKQDK